MAGVVTRLILSYLIWAAFGFGLMCLFVRFLFIFPFFLGYLLLGSLIPHGMDGWCARVFGA